MNQDAWRDFARSLLPPDHYLLSPTADALLEPDELDRHLQEAVKERAARERQKLADMTELYKEWSQTASERLAERNEARQEVDRLQAELQTRTPIQQADLRHARDELGRWREWAQRYSSWNVMMVPSVDDQLRMGIDEKLARLKDIVTDTQARAECRAWSRWARDAACEWLPLRVVLGLSDEERRAAIRDRLRATTF